MTLSRRLLASLAVLLAVGVVVVGGGTYSAFSSSPESNGNSFAAGTVYLSDNDAGAAMLSLTNAVPGNSDTSCLKVTYAGSLPATVRLYGSSSGALASYLTLTVTRGTNTAPSFDSCTGFTADATNYIGAGTGVVYSGSLSAYPTAASPLIEPTAGAPETWTASEVHSYRFVISLDNNLSAQGQSATASFTWEARNQ
ncbi:MAG TPA: TasA family protein [Solirubrobacteraceae bacterium]|nr:TasA family protein [Solirubrobacteraceae bacterium]